MVQKQAKARAAKNRVIGLGARPKVRAGVRAIIIIELRRLWGQNIT